MPWIIGIDEAGYGPNLGPFVMTSVACRLPEEQAGADLWQLLRSAVRRHKESDDGRLLIEDSKLVYSTARGLLALETGVLASGEWRVASGEWRVASGEWRGKTEGCSALPDTPLSSLATRHSPLATHEPLATLHDFLGRLCPAAQADLRDECWYVGSTPLPVTAAVDDLGAAAQRFAQVCQEAHVVWGLVRSVIVCPTRFNALLDRWDSKAIVLGLALAELLHCNHDPDGGTEPVAFYIDKHGGRNNYASLLQQAVPEGMVLAEEEGRERSVYRVLGLKRPVQLTFAPRADASYFCVALASMVSKYLREVLMLEFNHFWRTHVPDLKPTAGYPGDAARFFTAIRPALAKLGIAEAAVWRRK